MWSAHARGKITMAARTRWAAIVLAGLAWAAASLWLLFGAPSSPWSTVAERLYRAFADALATPEVRARLATFLAEPAPLAPDAFGAFVKSELAKYERIVKATGARVE